MKRRITTMLAVAGVVAATSGAVVSASVPAELTPVSVGAFLSVNGAPLLVAHSRGYFEGEGLDVEITPITTSADGVPLLATGRIDALYGASQPALFNTIGNGTTLRYVANGGVFPETDDYYFGASFVALADGPVQSVADLEGQKIAVNGGFAGTSAYWLSRLLEQADLTIDDVEVVTLSVPEGLTALENGAVVAAVSTGAALSQSLADGTHIILGDYSPVLAGGTGAAFLFGEQLLENDRETGVAFLRALLRAVSDDLGDDASYIDNPEIVDILATEMNLPAESFAGLRAPRFDSDLAMSADGLLSMQEFWIQTGQLALDEPLTADQIVDTSLLEEAIAALG